MACVHAQKPCRDLPVYLSWTEQIGVSSRHYVPAHQRITGGFDVCSRLVCYTLRATLGGPSDYRVGVPAMPLQSSPIMTEWPGHDVPPTPDPEPASDSPLVNSGADPVKDGDVIKDDRRETPRLTAENLAYIHLEPDSGAIVLNVSDGGLCFHAVAPLHQTGVVRFWFSLRADQRMEVIGELAWTDETKKTCGLRFTSLPVGAQEQIRKWVSQPTTEPVIRRHSPPPAAAAEAFAPPLLPQLPFPQSDLRPSAGEQSPVHHPLFRNSPYSNPYCNSPYCSNPYCSNPYCNKTIGHRSRI